MTWNFHLYLSGCRMFIFNGIQHIKENKVLQNKHTSNKVFVSKLNTEMVGMLKITILDLYLKHDFLNTFKYHVFAPMGRFQLESIYLYFPPSSQLLSTVNCSSQETEVTSTPTKPVDNVVIATKGLQDRKIQQLGRRWKIKVN